jgi:hypothetical protein
MQFSRLQHDLAFEAGGKLLETVSNALRPEEHKDAFCEFYRIVLAAIEAYEIQAQREAVRLSPSRN